MLNQKINRENIIKMVENDQIKTDITEFHPGDTVIVFNKIVENKKTRIQKFEGIVLRIRGKGIGKTFIVRKESNGIWVERNFFLNSPMIEKIDIVKRGKVRRAYLTYMRKRSGKTARIAEKKVDQKVKPKKITKSTIKKEDVKLDKKDIPKETKPIKKEDVKLIKKDIPKETKPIKKEDIKLDKKTTPKEVREKK